MSRAVHRMVELRKTNVQKVKRRARESQLGTFSGKDALAEVAKDDGLWNWALVGPDPEALPLSGGGMGSVDEMKSAVGKHAYSFGLLRMSFGTGGNVLHKWLLIHASDPIDSGYSAVQRGQAMGMEPMMDKAMRRFVAVAGMVHVQSKEECTLEHFVSELRSMVSGLDADTITVESFNAALEAHKEANPEIKKKETLKQANVQIMEQLVTPMAELVAAEVQSISSAVPEERRQRKRVKLYVTGDQVDIYSAKHGKWFTDAEIAEVITETRQIDGHRVRAGSMKVIYDNGSRIKWVAPQQMEELLRSSTRPRPPESVSGNLLKETNSWLGARHAEYYFELTKGWLQWWATQTDAQQGGLPENSVYLLGLQLEEEGASFRLRSDHSDGAVFGFKAENEEDASHVWVEGLWLHACYCEEVRDYLIEQQNATNERSELLSAMQNKFEM